MGNPSNLTHGGYGMRDEITSLRGHFQNKRRLKELVPQGSCERCGRSQAECKDYGRQLELHHIKSLKDCVDEGLKDKNWINSYDNLHTLCYWCHKEWHGWWEIFRPEYEAYFKSPPFMP